MPSVKGESIHRVIFVTTLSCNCDVLFHVASRVNDYLLCFRHNRPARVVKVTRRNLLQDAS